MNTETDDLLPDGTHLKNEMVVLVKDPLAKEEIKSGMTIAARARARIKNQWCTVSHCQITHDGNSVSFVAVYEDGFRAQRTLPIDFAWIVRKSTLV